MGARGPKPGFKRAAQAAALALAQAASAQASQPVAPAAVVAAPSKPPEPPPPPAEQPVLPTQERRVLRDPLQRAREIKTMQGDELRDYARLVGVQERDVTGLSEDRLRQNCMLLINAQIEALTE